MGEIILPRRMFLWCMAVIYLAAFVSLYVQMPGLYGNEGLLPARWQLRYSGKPLGEQLLSSPTLLWLGPRLGLDTHTATELLCLIGSALSLGAMLFEALRDSVVFFCLWVLYLSLYQLPVWWQKLSVMATFVIEIAAPPLFFSPLRRLRLGAFYMQVFLQVLIILTGNYNFFNLLTVALCLSLLDDQHVHFWLRKADKITNNDSKLWTWLCYLLELAVWALMIFGAIVFFDLQVDTTKKLVNSRIAFTYHQFNQFLKTVTIPCVWIGVLSLTWEIVTSMFSQLQLKTSKKKQNPERFVLCPAVIELIQTDVSQYPFHEQPPAYLRAHRYRYWFTEPKADGSHPQRWWRRVYDEEFYPTVHLGNTFLDSMITQYGLKDKSPARRLSNKPVAQAVRWVRSQVRGVPAHILIWTLMGCGVLFCLLQGLQSRKRKRTTVSDHAENVPDGSSDHCEKSGEHQAAKEVEEEDEEGSEDEVEQGEGEEKDTVDSGDDKEDEAQDDEDEDETEEEDEKTEIVRKRRP
ncbi:Lipase maturation factor 2 [Collichthys lucidus]|uniref:Lipase maturation factor n=1 Tax=Collichthys lucidus TaxID=240159 RepID=A0A4U5UGV8_COLLU|nr:Lipase maturation factor 2 [Collichthys lucidus]